MPGSVLPSRYSSDAPPPVEMWENPSSGTQLPHRRRGVAAADDAERALGRGGDDGLGHASGARRVRRELEHAHRPFQKTVLALDSSAVNRFTDSGPMSRPISSSGIAFAGHELRRRVGGELLGHDDVHRQWMTSA
jgi:hypothetical protein